MAGGASPLAGLCSLLAVAGLCLAALAADAQQVPPADGQVPATISFVGIQHEHDNEQVARASLEQCLQSVTGHRVLIDTFDMSNGGLIVWHSSTLRDCNEPELGRILASIRNPQTGEFTREFKMSLSEHFKPPDRIELNWLGPCENLARKRTLPAASSRAGGGMGVVTVDEASQAAPLGNSLELAQPAGAGQQPTPPDAAKEEPATQVSVATDEPTRPQSTTEAPATIPPELTEEPTPATPSELANASPATEPGQTGDEPSASRSIFKNSLLADLDSTTNNMSLGLSLWNETDLGSVANEPDLNPAANTTDASPAANDTETKSDLVPSTTELSPDANATQTSLAPNETEPAPAASATETSATETSATEAGATEAGATEASAAANQTESESPREEFKPIPIEIVAGITTEPVLVEVVVDTKEGSGVQNYSTSSSSSSSGRAANEPHYGKYVGLTTGFLIFVAYLICARAYRRQGMYELQVN